MKRQLLLTACLLFGLTTAGAAQSIAVRGTVTDAETGFPLPGVNIVVEGTTSGTSTDSEGRYSIDVLPGGVLAYSFVGFVTERVTITNQNVVNVSMRPDMALLDDVVVVGYGTMKKTSVTSSISKIENEMLDQIPGGRAESALAGRLAGVSVVSPRNQPGAAPHIRIRGIGSIDAGNDPLLVIDGYPGGSWDQINMNDVESIEVLKDPSSTAIYGSRGATGVILITTKRGLPQGMRLDYNSYMGASKPMVHDDWLTGEEWHEYLVKYQNREFAWAGGDPSIPVWGDDRRQSTYRVNPLTYELPQTVWQDEVVQVAPIQSHNLSLAGGSENTKFYVSGTYKNEDGTIITTNYKQYSLRANLDVAVNDLIGLGFEISPTYTKRRISGRTVNNFAKYPPFVPRVDENGRYPRTQDYIPAGHSGQASPLVYLFGERNFNDRFYSHGRAFVTLNFTEGLVLKSSFGANIGTNTTEFFRGGAGDPFISTLGYDINRRDMNLLNENTLTYSRTVNTSHEINALLGASYQRDWSTTATLRSRTGSFNNQIIRTLNNAIIDAGRSSTFKSAWGLVSYFTRLNYGFRDKYLLSAVFRTDGSSRFGPESKWGYFPSISAAWRVSEEPFMQGLNAISALKLRASYGVTGNNNIGNYTFLGSIGTVTYAPDNVHTQGQVQTSFENAQLSWEETVGIDFGIEMGLFDDRVSIVADYYDNRTSDLLYRVNTPAITGFTTTFDNIGEVRNYGVELELQTRNLVGDFSWRTSFNASRNYNEVVDLGDVDERIHNHSWGMAWILREGEPMFSYYGYKIQGIFQNEEQIAGMPSLPGTKPGNPIIADRNGDGKIDADDKEILGHFMPNVLLGLVNDFAWKQFDLSIAVTANLGSKMFNGENQYYEGNTLGAMRRSLVKNQWWSEEEPGDGMTPAAALSQLTTFNANTDYYIENASYLSVRNINLGYTLPRTYAERFGMRSLRVYTSINNLLLIRDPDNHAYNPEGFTRGEVDGINSEPGFNIGSEPVARVITAGINLGL